MYTLILSGIQVKRANGSTDTFLNKTGIEQGKRLAEKLRDVSFDVSYCSSQTRARQFCELIYKGSVAFDERLIEINCGKFEGMEETPEMMKSFWLAIKSGDKGTENFELFIKRNCDLCDEITAEYKGKNILIVTHAANVRVINYYFNGKPKNYDFNKRIIDKAEFITFVN